MFHKVPDASEFSIRYFSDGANGKEVSLHDQLAIAAMGNLITAWAEHLGGEQIDYDGLATVAYGFADAMMRARFNSFRKVSETAP